MLSSGSAQTLGDGIYLWHHSKKLEHLYDESHCREKQHFQTDELLRSMSVVELHPISQSLLSVPLLQINWNSPDLHYLLQHSMFLKTWPYLLSPISSQAHLCLSLRPSCQQFRGQKDASSSCIKVVWCWPMILKGIRGLEWTGKERSWTGVWQAKVQLLEETRLKALQFFLRSKIHSLYGQESDRDFQNQKPTTESMFGTYKKHSFKIVLINSKTDLWAVLCSTASTLHSWFIMRIHI